MVNKEIPANIVYEDDMVLGFLDISPVNAGHVLVIPKKHFKDLFEVEENYLTAVTKAIPKIAKSVLDAVDAKDFNLIVNNGEIAGQVIPHLHFHIIPRFTDDGHELFHGKEMSPDELSVIADKIKSA
ncbi:HIT domain-containing protein [Candidatus Falkowbacteria bacterium]|jgi:histidine triad (HIT) family protein|nr:HIT domain-containing protein [Candidatus Falkowbacteria bacterium]MBT7007520.1 HIT domain-containing protein [Candidatus Falkowbacteria bacterium]